jgi:hypothetical protein
VTETADNGGIGAELRQVMGTLALDATVAEIVPALRMRGIDPILLKGAGTARWLYDRPAERPYTDVDLLVAPGDVGTATAALTDRGFATKPAPVSLPGDGHHHAVLVRPGNPTVQVEVHHTLFLLSSSPALVWERFNATATSISLAEVDVRTPAPAAAALIVALHALQHGPVMSHAFEDLRRAITQVDDDVWRDAAALAAHLGATADFAAGLRLVEPGARLAERLGLPVLPVRLVVRLRATGPDTSLGVERFIRARGTRGRIALVAEELVPTPAFMRIWQPVARRGRWGLAAAYLWRPAWLAVKIPQGVWAWVRAYRGERPLR